MPLKLTITVGPNTFEADGDFEFTDALSAIFTSWVNVLGDGAGATLTRLTNQLDANTGELAAAVDEHTLSPR